jgi:hypothetical protein
VTPHLISLWTNSRLHVTGVAHPFVYLFYKLYNKLLVFISCNIEGSPEINLGSEWHFEGMLLRYVRHLQGTVVLCTA